MALAKVSAFETLVKKTVVELELAKEQVSQLTGQKFGKSSETSRTISRSASSESGKHRKKKNNPGSAKANSPKETSQGTGAPERGRRPTELPDDAPVLSRDYPLLQEYCDCCEPDSSGLYENGWTHQTRVTVIVKHFVVHERFQKKKCVSCGKDFEAPRPSLTQGRTYDPGFAADIVSSKFVDAVSLDRQHNAMVASGFQLAQSTLCRAVNDLGLKLIGLKPFLLSELRSSSILSIDETRVPTYDEDKRAYSLGWGWALTNFGRYIGVRRQVILFDHTQRRRTIDAAEIIKVPPETLLSDGAYFYNETSSQGAERAFCHAHARRRFVEAFSRTGSDAARRVVELYQQLYALEEAIAWSDPETRTSKRQADATSVLDRISEICRAIQDVSEPGSLIGKAAAYFLNHEDGLRTYLTNGRIEIDNNAVERAIRKIALVRKNCLFAGSKIAADVWMFFASLVATCEVNDIDPRRYLFWLCFKASQSPLDQIPFEQLLPWNFADAEALGTKEHLAFMDHVTGHSGRRYRDVKPRTDNAQLVA